jgi:hypothetical protein
MPSTSPDLAITTPANLPVPLGFAPPSLTRDEDASPYETLRARVAEAVRPGNFIEEILVRDVLEHVWETVRMRRQKAALINSSAKDGMLRLLLALDYDDAVELAKGWFAREPAAIAEVDARLAEAGLGIDAAMAQTLRLHLADYEGMDRMLRSAEARRDAALLAIERHRAHLADRLRRAAHEAAQAAEQAPIEDVAFEVVQTVQTGQHPAATG